MIVLDNIKNQGITLAIYAKWEILNKIDGEMKHVIRKEDYLKNNYSQIQL